MTGTDEPFRYRAEGDLPGDWWNTSRWSMAFPEGEIIAGLSV